MKHKCNFVSNGKFQAVICEKCDKKNNAISVSSGECTWCGFDHNSLISAIKSLK